MKLELTPDQANNLAGLLDIAVKAGGIRSAAPALEIFRKLEESLRSSQPVAVAEQKEEA